MMLGKEKELPPGKILLQTGFSVKPSG